MTTEYQYFDTQTDRFRNPFTHELLCSLHYWRQILLSRLNLPIEPCQLWKNVLIVGLSTVASLYVLAFFIIGIIVLIRIHRQPRPENFQSEALEDADETTQISTDEF